MTPPDHVPTGPPYVGTDAELRKLIQAQVLRLIAYLGAGMITITGGAVLYLYGQVDDLKLRVVKIEVAREADDKRLPLQLENLRLQLKPVEEKLDSAVKKLKGESP